MRSRGVTSCSLPYILSLANVSRAYRKIFVGILTTNHSICHIVLGHVRILGSILKISTVDARRYFRLNTRQIIRGRGTDNEVSTNNINVFHLGTRVPTVGHIEIGCEQQWETGKVS